LDVEIDKGKKNGQDVTFKGYAGRVDPNFKPSDMHF